MEIYITEEYDGELKEKRAELMKALFPNTRSMNTLKIPERDFRDKVYRELLDDLEKNYKQELEVMWDEIEIKLAEWFGK